MADLLSYASNIRDVTGYGFGWQPARVHLVNEKNTPMSFPGFWGASGAMSYETGKSNGLEDGGEPRTPTLQPLWYDPIDTIFCGFAGPGRPPHC